SRLDALPQVTHELRDGRSFATQQQFEAFLSGEPLLERLRAHPDVAADVLGSPKLAVVLPTAPEFVTAVARTPKESRPALTGNGSLHVLLIRTRDLAGALADRDDLRHLFLSASRTRLTAALLADQKAARALIDAPSLVAGLRLYPSLIDEITGGSALWRALLRHPGLAPLMKGQLRRSLNQYAGVTRLLAE
ncbi:hypothetical protein DMH15_42440, partial [Streptomyces sp. WAC 06725]